VFDSALGKIAALCAAKGAKLVSLVFPMFDFPFDAKYPLADVHEIIRVSLAKHGIPALDLRGAYTHIPHDRLQVIPGVDSHPNELAHRIAAERLLAFLATNQLVPSENIPVNMYPQRRAMQTRRTSASQVWMYSLRPLEVLDFTRKPRKQKSSEGRRPKKHRKR
jgi:hypothetical protein